MDDEPSIEIQGRGFFEDKFINVETFELSLTVLFSIYYVAMAVVAIYRLFKMIFSNLFGVDPEYRIL